MAELDPLQANEQEKRATDNDRQQDRCGHAAAERRQGFREQKQIVEAN
jgi:hypothetical protein